MKYRVHLMNKEQTIAYELPSIHLLLNRNCRLYKSMLTLHNDSMYNEVVQDVIEEEDYESFRDFESKFKESRDTY